MPKNTWKHLSDAALAREFADAIRDDRVSKVRLLSLIAEAEVRKLHLPAAYPSMYKYCVGEFGLTRDVAYKLIRAARAARRFPRILTAIEEGRLTVAAVVLLAPYLKSTIALELLSLAERKTRGEVRALLESRGLLAPMTSRVVLLNTVEAESTPEPVAGGSSSSWVAPSGAPEPQDPAQGRPNACSTPGSGVSAMSCQSQELAPGPVVDAGETVLSTRPVAARLELLLDHESLDQLRRAQDLMSHTVPSGDPSEIFKRALALFVGHLEKRKFAATESPRAPRACKDPRHIPAHVKRAVRERDGEQCTFVSETGRRCEETRQLEFDHDLEVARGGDSTVANVRLRCRAHNQFTAERTYGEGFMNEKRNLKKVRATARRDRRVAREQENATREAARERAIEEIPWLGEMARRAAEAITGQPDVVPPPLPS